uniref:Uncharacterized protein n=1 Tax=Guillardia theta TaxID=55529 RepID=A0A7S4PJ52_GUITH
MIRVESPMRDDSLLKIASALQQGYFLKQTEPDEKMNRAMSLIAGSKYAFCDLSLDGSKVLELRSNDTHAAINSSFPGHGHEGDPVSKLLLRFSRLLIHVSSETTPTLMSIWKRMSSALQTSNKTARKAPNGDAAGKNAHQHLSRSFSAFTTDAEYETQVKERKKSFKEALHPSQTQVSEGQMVMGAIAIVGEEIHVTCFDSSIAEGVQCCQVSIHDVVLNFQMEENLAESDMYRFLQLKANMVYVIRVSKGPPSKDITCNRIKQGVMRHLGADYIVHIPDITIDLSTIQICSGGKNRSKLVHCEFDSNFKSPIEVNVDFYQYEYLQQLFKRYKNSRRDDMSSDFDHPPLNDLFSPLSESQSRSSLQREKNLTQGLKLDYRCLKFKLEPPIAAISEVPIDIITILSWLGIRKRETIVGMLHEGIIQNSEKILDQVNARLKGMDPHGVTDK